MRSRIRERNPYSWKKNIWKTKQRWRKRIHWWGGARSVSGEKGRKSIGT